LVRAGHTNPILIPGKNDQAVQEIDISGLGIGLTSDNALFRKSLPLFEYRLVANDKVVFFTDGIVEAAIPGKLEQYGDERLLKIIQENRSIESKSLVDVISRDLDRFYKDNPRVDDYTIMILNKLA
jgi:sigma-B regulation protein RsbU (phosphoserine phosphatase)